MKNLVYIFLGFAFILICLSFENSRINNNEIDIIIVLKEQLNKNHIGPSRSKIEKGWYVYSESKKIANSSQKEIIQYLSNNELQYHSFHIINAIKVSSVPSNIIEVLLKFEEIDYIQEDTPVKLIHEDRINNSVDFFRDIEWGIQKIGADLVWEEYGAKGSGVIIAGQDTGYEWEHPALKNSYRGWDGNNVEHDYNWHDAIHDFDAAHTTQDNSCGLDVMEPCDDNGHGTHTMGTMVGKAENEQIGVAPEAKWIACRNMERGWGTPSTYIECFEWFLAPTDLDGNNPDVSKSPHVINNSWGCPESEGCNPDNFNTMKMVVDNLKAAGIMVVVSAGNGGSNGCGSVSNPAAIFENSFSIGASDSNDTLANFSSRGAVIADGSLRIKPNVSAPGVSVRSSTRGGNYGSASGTSMAGPHVAGVVALMISANPKLAGQVDQIETILEQTAIPISARSVNECNGTTLSDIPNNIFGYGRIDAYAAVKAAINNAYDYNEEGAFVFPNPSQNEFQFLIPSIDGKTQIHLWDSSGRLILNGSMQFNTNSASIDLSPYSNGVYFYRITKSNQSFTGKLLKH